jgi:hypothetical protein
MPWNPLAYDYERTADPNLAIACAKKIHAEIDGIKEALERINRSKYNIGRELTLAKTAFFHGQWGDWLEAEFEWSQDTAENYMRLYRVFNEERFRTLRNLEGVVPLTTLYQLTRKSTPDEVRQELVEDLDLGRLNFSDPTLNREIIYRMIQGRDGRIEHRPANEGIRAASSLRYTIRCVQILKTYLPPAALQEFREHFPHTNHAEFNRVLQARAPNYNERGFVSNFPILRDTGEPIPTRDLGDYLLEAMTTPDEVVSEGSGTESGIDADGDIVQIPNGSEFVVVEDLDADSESDRDDEAEEVEEGPPLMIIRDPENPGNIIGARTGSDNRIEPEDEDEDESSPTKVMVPPPPPRFRYRPRSREFMEARANQPDE